MPSKRIVRESGYPQNTHLPWDLEVNGASPPSPTPSHAVMLPLLHLPRSNHFPLPSQAPTCDCSHGIRMRTRPPSHAGQLDA
jgi:hypothetical protein